MTLKLDQNKVRRHLIKLAKQRRTCGYKELADNINGEGSYTIGNRDGVYVGDIIGDVSIEEAAQNRPLLSVLVLNQQSKIPGKRFFDLAKNLGLFQGNPDNKEHQREYTKYELARVWDYWSTEFDSSDDEEITLLNQDFNDSKTPNEKEYVVKRVERGQLATKIKAFNGYKCQICEALGQHPLSFLKRDNVPYIEAHHVMPVSTRKQGVLSASNIITVCANHHRQLHYGKSTVSWGKTTDTYFIFNIDDKTIKIKRLSQDDFIQR